MKTENKNGSIVAIVILAILVVGLGGYIVYDKFLSKNVIETTEENSKSEMNTKTENKINEETNTYKALTIDNSNCLTDCNNIEYTLGSSIAGDGIEVWIANNENTKINVNINRTLLKNIYAYEFSSNEDMYTFEFTKKIQDTFVGHIGQDSSMPMLFVLLEDGSVQYVDLYSKITSGNASPKELSNVQNIIKFYSAGVRTKESETSGVMTVLAQTFDGKFYDLEKIIYNNQ